MQPCTSFEAALTTAPGSDPAAARSCRAASRQAVRMRSRPLADAQRQRFGRRCIGRLPSRSRVRSCALGALRACETTRFICRRSSFPASGAGFRINSPHSGYECRTQSWCVDETLGNAFRKLCSDVDRKDGPAPPAALAAAWNRLSPPCVNQATSGSTTLLERALPFLPQPWISFVPDSTVRIPASRNRSILQ